MIHAHVWHLERMIGAVRMHSIHSHGEEDVVEEGMVVLGELARRAWWWWCRGERAGMGEEGGVGSFFMFTKIIAVWSMTEESSSSICMSIIIIVEVVEEEVVIREGWGKGLLCW